jgi:hypothetical protein
MTVAFRWMLVLCSKAQVIILKMADTQVPALIEAMDSKGFRRCRMRFLSKAWY